MFVLRIIVIASILSILGDSGTLHAQEFAPKFERISLEQGLSQTAVNCILQDSKGFLWFGTQDGLNKYDGYTFTVYKTEPFDPTSLSSNWIHSLYEDRAGTLWVGTRGGGLNRFHRETETFTHWAFDPADTGGLRYNNNSIMTIHEGRDGALWLGTNGGGLVRFDREAETFTLYIHDPQDPTSIPHNVVMDILDLENGEFWIGTMSGLSRFDRDTETFANILTNPDVSDALQCNQILKLYANDDGTFSVGTMDGLRRFNPATGEVTPWFSELNDLLDLTDTWVSTILEDRTGALWIGTVGKGVIYLNPATGDLSHWVHDPGDEQSLSNNDVLTIFEDHSGVIWVGTFGGGLNKYNSDKRRFAHWVHETDNPNSLPVNFVHPIFEDHAGIIWIGTLGEGLTSYDPQTKLFKRWNSDPQATGGIYDGHIYAIGEDAAGVLWVGTINKGIEFLDPDRESFKALPFSTAPHGFSGKGIRTFLLDSKGTMWIGTSNGLYRYEAVTGEFAHWEHEPDNPKSLSHNLVEVIYEDVAGGLWLGTHGGLNLFDPQTGTFTRWVHDQTNRSSLNVNQIMSIHEDRAGILWIGTFGGGLNRFDREAGVFTHFREAEGLPNDVVYGILEDDRGNLWLSTNNGLSKFNPYAEIFKNYDVNDGLQSNEFNAKAHFKSRSGRMYFGGVNGISVFHPDSIRDNTHVPPVVVTAIRKYDTVIGTEITGTAHREISYKDQYLTFDFVAIDYRNPAKNRNAYRLVGFDEHWIDAGTRHFASYTNLDPGEYTFRVKGSNSDGVWNNAGVSIHITVTPPFWATWWFKMLTLIGVFGVVFGAYRIKVQSIRSQNKWLEREVTERTHEIADTNVELNQTVRELRNTQAQLVQSEKMASLGNLAAGVAHEVNNPISAVSSAADIAQRCIRKITDVVDHSKTGEDIRGNRQFQKSLRILVENNRVIETASARIAKIVQSLKKFARLDEEAFQKADLHEGLDSTLTLVNHTLKNRIRIEKAYGDIPAIACYANQLNQIFMNLLINAEQAIDGEGVIRIATSADDRNVYIEISDTGKGIPPEHLQKIFDPGFTTKGVGVGTGLGLSICYNIIQKHHGQIRAESTPGDGTTFTITLPIYTGTTVGVNDAPSLV